MNEYLITQLGVDHRNTLLAEAAASRLAGEVTAGRPSWWRRLSARTTARASKQRGPRAADHRLAA